MTRLGFVRWLFVAALLAVDLALLAPAARAAGSVAVSAWNCGPTVDPNGTDPAAFAAACAEEADGITFALTAGEITRRRATAPGKPAAWPAVAAAFTLAIDDPKGEPAVAFCTAGTGAPERLPAPNGEIAGDVTGDLALVCQWYRLPAAAAPTATATSQATATATSQPSATPQPTATQQPTSTPTATAPPAAPTATQFPTATQQPSATATPEITATPTTPPLPEPIDTGDPKMFGGDAGHTGRQGEAGPKGDPVLLWRTEIGSILASSPIVAAGVVYVGADDGVYALDALNGEIVWQVETEEPVTASPAVIAGVVYIGGVDGIFRAIDAGTGVIRWEFPTGGKIRASAAWEDDVIYVSSYDGNLYALDAETGEERWRFRLDADELSSSPAVENGVVFVAGGSIDGGRLYAVDATSGEQLWRYGVSGVIGSSPTVLGSTVYVGSEDGVLYAVDVASGDGVCRHTTNKPMRSSPAVLDGVVVIGNRSGRLYALNSGTCDEIWQFRAGDWVDSPPAVAGSTLYFGSKDDFLYALNATTGEERWSFEAGGSITTAPAVAGGVVYFTCRDGYLYAVTGTENEGDVAPPEDDDGGDDGDDETPTAAANARGGLPAELELDGAFYRRDRAVPVSLDDLGSVGTADGVELFSAVPVDATTSLYAADPDDEDGRPIRYLPERLGDAEVACAAELATVTGALSAGDLTYAFAGAEFDFTIDQLAVILDASDVGAIYADTETAELDELFVDSVDGLQRFVLLDDDGLPVALQGEFPFGGQTFAFTENVTGQVDAGELSRAGCAGPFALEAEPDGVGAPFGRLYAEIAGALLAFDPVS